MEAGVAQVGLDERRRVVDRAVEDDARLPVLEGLADQAVERAADERRLAIGRDQDADARGSSILG
jgi:hypothetical protein